MSQLIIFRGLPGAGKTTAARNCQAKTGAILIEPDALCVTDGEYNWTPERWAAAVELAAVTIEMLTGGEFDREGAAMRPDIIYADVLPTAEEVQAVIDHVPRDYTVTILTLSDAMGKSVHSVRAEDYARMRAEFEEVSFENGRVVSEGLMFAAEPAKKCRRTVHPRDFTAAGHNSRPDKRNAAEGREGGGK